MASDPTQPPKSALKVHVGKENNLTSSSVLIGVLHGALCASEGEARAPKQIYIWLLVFNLMDSFLLFLPSSLILSEKRTRPLDFKEDFKRPLLQPSFIHSTEVY